LFLGDCSAFKVASAPLATTFKASLTDLQPSSHVLVKPPDEVPARADADDVPATKDVDKTFAEKRSAEAAGMTTAVLPLGRLNRRGDTRQLVGHA